MSTDNANLNILHRDSAIIVAVKPRGFLSELSPGSDRSFPALLLDALHVNEIFPVHRLDRDTEGIMVYALTKSAAAALSASVANGLFDKEYDAWVHGVPDEPEGKLEDLLFRDTRSSKVFVVKRERKGVKRAVLNYRTIETVPVPGAGVNSLISHVRIRLETGRTHQIRVQFASRGMPVLGDRKYGAADNYPPIALAATSLLFPHPVNGEKMRFEIPFAYAIEQGTEC
ncbi:MAG: RluA family pseudouridine synthase [Clostridia bacterium]|nr:RluA family pseudouridine synthase [Clostridia bacterium]